jgi:hypothetical protein
MDDVLRGHKADPSLLANGTSHIQVSPLVMGSTLLGIAYGGFMGLYAVAPRTPPSFVQLIAAAVKVPALFFLTLIVTFPLAVCIQCPVRRAPGVTPMSWLRNSSCTP